MLLKAIATIVFTPLIAITSFFHSSKPEIYIAPKDSPKATTTQKTTAASTGTEKIKVVPKATSTPKKIQKDSKPQETKEIIATTTSYIPPDFEKINTESRKTIVNIFCTTKYNELSPISGTGVVVNGDGLILTNAHIGQYMLLRNFREKDYLKCVGRTGSPAYPKYNIELVYISPDWVKANKTLLKDQDPKGTGESDFAFLRITGEIDGEQNKNGYTYITPNTREYIAVGEPVLLVSYPAGFLGGLSIIQNLNVASSITQIQDVFTFKNGTIDIVSVGGTIVSQKGSSGGLVVDSNTSLIGIISTSSDGDTTSSRGLNAITVSHINREVQRDLKINLRQFLDLNHKNFAESFATSTAPELTKLITEELLRSN